jgi:hypothetical protein
MVMLTFCWSGLRDSYSDYAKLPVCDFTKDRFSVGILHSNERDSSILDEDEEIERQERKIKNNLKKHKRVSIWAAMNGPADRLAGTPAHKWRTATLGPALAENVRTSIAAEPGFPRHSLRTLQAESDAGYPTNVLEDVQCLTNIFAFFTESELLCTLSLVSSLWADAATLAHADLLIASVGPIEDDETEEEPAPSSAARALQRSWTYLNERFPWAKYLSDGTFKKVHKVYNSRVGREEAVSIM